jgi:hypothetical protein
MAKGKICKYVLKRVRNEREITLYLLLLLERNIRDDVSTSVVIIAGDDRIDESGQDWRVRKNPCASCQYPVVWLTDASRSISN